MRLFPSKVIILLVLVFSKIAFSSNFIYTDEECLSLYNSQDFIFSTIAVDTQEIIVYNNVDVGVVQDTIICIHDSAKLVCYGDKVFAYEWIDDDTGLIIGNGDELYVSPKTTKTYTLNLYYFTGELISNGDFNNRYDGFDSDYKVPKKINNKCLWPEGYYVVGDNPVKYHTSFRNMSDHTTGNGNMVIVNGAPNPGVKVWGQWVDVVPNTVYAFSTWAVSVCSGSPADLRFTIDGELLGEQFQLVNHTASNPAQWAQFYALWDSGNKSRVYISLKNMTIATSGNDFALDDISFASMTKVSKKVIVRVHPNIKYTCLKDTVICEGDDLDMKVNAYGSNLKYSWYHDNVLINDTDSVLSINCSERKDSGDYKCNIEGVCGSESISLSLGVIEKTKVGFVSDTSVCYGSELALQVLATGHDLAYSWSHNGTPLSEKTNTLNLTSLDYLSNGNYSCTVSGTCGDTTVMMNLVVDTITKINSISSDTILCPGQPVILKVEAEGTGLSYSWARDGLVISGETTPVLRMDTVIAGSYVVRINGVCGEISDTIKVGKYEPTIVSSFTADTSLCYGSELALQVLATGHDLAYSWSHNGTPLSENTNTLNLSAVDYTSAGNYSCVVSGTCGDTTVMMNLVVDTITKINSISSDTILCPGQSVILKVEAEGTGLSYSWERDGFVLSEETNPVLRMDTVIAGSYVVRINGVCGEILDTTKVDKYESTIVSSFTADTSLCYGSELALQVLATGHDLAYSWSHNGTSLSENTNTLNLASVDYLFNGNYSCTVSGTCGDTTVMMNLVVDTITKINSISSDTILCPGQSVILKVEAEGTGLSYSWARDGLVISGETTPVLTMDTVIAGSYIVRINGACGEILDTINVGKYESTIVSSFTADTSLCYGSELALQVLATGHDLAYSWSHNGTSLSENTNTLNLASVDYLFNGNYSCTVSGTCGDTTVMMNLVVDTITKINSISSDTILCPGQPVILKVEAEGTGLSYSWERDGLVISGETNPVLRMDTVVEGSYIVRINGACGEILDTIKVDKYESTIVSSFTADTSLCYGSELALQVLATGHDLAYSWSHNGTPLSENTNTLNLASVDYLSNGNYSCTVSGTCGDTTVMMNLVVDTITKINSISSDTILCPGQPVILKVEAEGTGLSYSWARDGLVISGETTPVLTMDTVIAGSYVVRINGTCGEILDTINVGKYEPTIVSSFTADTSLCYGSELALQVLATGHDLAYSWSHNGTPLSENTNTLNLSAVDYTSAGNYSCVVSGTCGDTTVMMNLVVDTITKINSISSDTILCPGQPVILKVEAEGTGLSYSWERDGLVISGETNPVLRMDTVIAGSYVVRINGTCGEILDTINVGKYESTIVSSFTADTSLCYGSDLELSIDVKGDNLIYSWSHNGTSLLENTNTLNLASVDYLSNGNYSCTVSGTCGDTTVMMNLVVDTITKINSISSDTILCPGQPVILKVEAEGTGLSYSWERDGLVISGETNPVLRMDTVIAGSYVVRINGACGEILDTIKVDKYESTIVSSFTADTSLCYGSELALQVLATGHDLAYSWSHNGTPLSENTNTLNLSAVDYTSAGNYSCVVSGTCGDTTVMMNLVVDTITKINSISSDTILCPGQPVILKVEAEGTGLSYSWERDGLVISGETTPVLTMDTVIAGSYIVRIYGACGEILDTINVGKYESTIVSSFTADTSLCYGSELALQVLATGHDLAYSWSHNGTPLSENTKTLNLSAVDYTSAGNYSCVVSGTCGDTTVMMNLVVDTITKINSISSDTILCPGQSVILKVEAEGTGLSYSWERDGLVISGETNPVLRMDTVVEGSYIVRINGACGEILDTIKVDKYESTIVSSFTADTSLCYGSELALQVLATGHDLAYSWSHNGTPLSENTNTLNLASVDYLSNGNYSCTVSGTCGDTTVMMNLVVDTITKINSISSDTILCPGQPVILKVEAEGTGLSYSWARDGLVISGETTPVLTMDTVIAGSYVVRINGTCGEILDTINVGKYEPTIVSSFTADTSLCYGSELALQVLATGHDLAYSWSHNGTPLSENTNTLNLSAVDYTSAGNYSCVVSGTCGDTTVMMNLVVDTITKINSISSDTVLCPGAPLDLKIEAEGTGMTYVWTRNGALLENETSPELHLDTVIAGTYIVRVEGACEEKSGTIKVEKYLPTLVSSFTSDTSICYGNPLEISVTATGDNLKYTWSHNNTVVSGESTNTLNLLAVNYESAGEYSCVVEGTCGDTTLVMDVVVDTITKINDIIKDTTLCPLEPLDLKVEAEGTDLKYSWTRDGEVLENETSPELHLDTVIAGTYIVRVEGACGDESGTINVGRYLPTVVTGFSADTSVCHGSELILQVKATGDNLKYIWSHNNTVIEGSTTDTLNISAVDYASAGEYCCLVEGTCGDTTVVMDLNVLKLTRVNITDDKEECEGSFVAFKVDALGDSLKYNWSHEYLDFKSDKSEIFLNNILEKYAGQFKCDISGACGDTTVYTNLYVNELTKVVNHTRDTVVCEGDQLKLKVEANGSFLDYEWYMDKSEVKEASHVLYLNNLKRKDSLLFDCIISGVCGDTTVTMKVKVGGFELLTKDTDTTLCVGESINYTVLADVCDDSYKWTHNGNVISNTTKSFEINQIKPEDAGEYRCHVYGKCGDSTILLNLNVIDVPVIETDFDNINVVQGENIDLRVRTRGKQIKYIWCFGKDTLDSKSNLYSIKNADFDDEGIYECVVCNKCGEDRRSVNINVITKTTILSHSVDTSICENESLTMAVEAEGENLIYNWYHNGIKTGTDNYELDIVNADTTKSGVYRCIVDGDGGSDTCSIYLTVHALPRASIKGDMEVCDNSNNAYEAINVTQEVDYMWSVVGGDVIGDRDQVSCTAGMNIAGKGKVSLHIVSKSTGCSNIIESDIIVNALPVVDFDYRDTIGYCERIIPVNGGIPIGGKYIVDGVYSDTIYYKHGITKHELVYEVTDAKTSCINRDTVRVVRAENPYVILKDSVKIGSCNKYQINPNVSKGKYEWSYGSYLDDVNKFNPVFTPGKTSICKLIVTDDYGCEAKDSIKIFVADAPKVKAIQDTIIGICNELELDCNFKIDGDYNIEWSPRQSLNKSGNKTAIVICDEAGLKTYTVSITDEYGCCDKDSVKVEVVNGPELGDDKYCCLGDTLKIDFTEYSSVHWDDGFEDKNRELTNVGQYFVRVCDRFGCKDSVRMNVIALPHIILNDTVIYEGENIDLEPIIEDREGISYMRWQDGSSSYFYNASQQGYYTIEVENTLGCKSRKSMFLTVKKAYLAAPNAFSPGASGENNKFYLKEKDFRGDFEMVLFDRWGTEIYRTKEIGQKGGWNGEVKGVRCQPGAYVWVVYVNGKFWGKGYVMIVE